MPLFTVPAGQYNLSSSTTQALGVAVTQILPFSIVSETVHIFGLANQIYFFQSIES